MDNSAFISVKNTGRYDDFVRLMAATTDCMKSLSQSATVDFLKCQGEKLEWQVLKQMKELACEFGFSADEIRHTAKQHFPDIISENYFGVEVKATKSDSWCSVGSSITESLREDCVKKIFLFFGKLCPEDIDFRCKPYEDCMCDIAVTHNPRYLINMDLQNDDKTIFQKIGQEYDDFRLDDNRIETIKDYYRERYRESGKEMPWWIGEKPESSIIRNDGVIRLYSGLTKNEKNYLKVCGMILFPEVVNSQYGKLALWLCSRHSVVNPSIRDMYSAGGTMNVFVDEKLRSL